MIKNRYFKIFWITIFIFLFTPPLFINLSKASHLGETFLFFERMQTNQGTEMNLLITPGSDFNDAEEDRVLKIFFSGGSGDWCVLEGALSVEGVETSVVEVGDWDIDFSLPGELLASCNQDAGGDYIEISGIDNLTAETGYGVKISKDESIFKTASTAQEHFITVQMTEGMKIESTTFGMHLVSSDQVLVTAEVSNADTITCVLNDTSVDFGVLYKGGAFSTSSLGIQTTSTIGFYWAVYGHGNGADAGLYNSSENDLLSSEGIDGKVNLVESDGFGMLSSTSFGFIANDFQIDETGIFGSIGCGLESARVFLYSNAPEETIHSNIHYGARASLGAAEGIYVENLTYVCGGYLGEGAEFIGDEFDPIE